MGWAGVGVGQGAAAEGQRPPPALRARDVVPKNFFRYPKAPRRAPLKPKHSSSRDQHREIHRSPACAAQRID